MDSAQSQALPTRTPLGITQAVLLEVIVHGPVARSTIATRLDRSQARVSRVVANLLKAGLLREKAPESTDEVAGRPMVPLEAAASAMCFLGVKVTSEQVFGAVVDLSGTVKQSWTLPLLQHEPSDVVAAVTALLGEAQQGYPTIHSIGVGLGGRTIDQRFVRHASLLQWHDVPLAELLEAATGLPVVVENDVRALTHAEHWFGAARGHSTFAILTIGAGVGLGVVAGNVLVNGASSFAGAVGHQRLTDSPVTCELGHAGCARALIATPLLERRVSASLGRPMTLPDVLAAAQAGEQSARGACWESGYAIGLLIGDLANILDPGLVIISGEGAEVARFARPAIDQAMARSLHWAAEPPTLVLPDFDFAEWARGAAIVAMQSVLLGSDFPRVLERMLVESDLVAAKERPFPLRVAVE